MIAIVGGFVKKLYRRGWPLFEAHVQLFINIYFSMLSKSDEKLGMTKTGPARTGIIEETMTTLLLTSDNTKATYIFCYNYIIITIV